MPNLFEGPIGVLTAKIMAGMNAEAEAEAIDILNPGPSDTLLVIGFGAGVGVGMIASRYPNATIVAVDPSAAMHREASRRNRRAIAAGRARLLRTTADTLACPTSVFDGALGVNSLQMCEPIESTAAELARVMRPGARLVTLTHDWAMARQAGSVENWVQRTGAALCDAGFGEVASFAAKAEKGRSIGLSARRLDLAAGAAKPVSWLPSDPSGAIRVHPD